MAEKKAKTLPLPGNSGGDYNLNDEVPGPGRQPDNGNLGWDGLPPSRHSKESPGKFIK